MHPLEEAMLGCDMDGEGLRRRAGVEEGSPLIPTGPREGQVVSVPDAFSPIVCLWSPLVCLSLLSPQFLAGPLMRSSAGVHGGRPTIAP